MTGYLTAALAIVAGAVVFYRAQAEADDRSNPRCRPGTALPRSGTCRTPGSTEETVAGTAATDRISGS